MRHTFHFLCTLVALLAMVFCPAACNKKLAFDTDTTIPISFSDKPLAYPMATAVNEASGIADSKINPGYLWVQEDSGNPPQLFLVDHAAATVKKIFIKGASNIDWEDLALADGPDAAKKYIYIGEIGDNDAVHTVSAFYRFEEPVAATDTVRAFDLIRFSYDDGPRDAEAFIIDNITKDIYIITKREASSRLYKIGYPYSTATVNTAVFLQSLPYNGVVSAAVSNDGKGIIVKTYPALYYYSRSSGETIAQSLQKTYTTLAYQLEPQGEAVTFALDNSGFYTLSEKGLGGAQFLYFYQKK